MADPQAKLTDRTFYELLTIEIYAVAAARCKNIPKTYFCILFRNEQGCRKKSGPPTQPAYTSLSLFSTKPTALINYRDRTNENRVFSHLKKENANAITKEKKN